MSSKVKFLIKFPEETFAEAFRNHEGFYDTVEEAEEDLRIRALGKEYEIYDVNEKLIKKGKL